MSQQYDNEMRGIIGKNERKEKDSHPDIKGQCEILGVAYWISGWRKEKRDGSGSFYSLSFEPKETATAKPAPKQTARVPGADDEDSIPF